MILSEEHSIRRLSCRKIYEEIDGFCYHSKNLHNQTNYLITQCGRISRKLKEGSPLEEWESAMLEQVNSGISAYNESRPGKKEMQHISGQNGFLADAYFLSWYLKAEENYKAMPYATCAQICIQEVCRNWKAYYRSLQAFRKAPSKMTGCPRRPGYLDKKTGRNALVLTYQNIRVRGDGVISFPSFMKGITIRSRHTGIRQVRILTEPDRIRILLMYEQKEAENTKASGCMGIDPGVNNLLALSMDTAAEPVLINGKPLKSINQYYNRRKADLASRAKKANGADMTNRIRRLTAKRNRKVKDYLHKASRMVIRIAQENGIGTIIIGRNAGWKQEAGMGKKTNQTFTSIPHWKLIQMICYKAELAGIRVITVDESYTSGTSYHDSEQPEERYYRKSRRVKRGLFLCDDGYAINADINAAYQMMKKAGNGHGLPKGAEKVTRMNVA